MTVDMDAGKGRGHDLGLHRIVKTAKPHILGNSYPHTLKHAHGVKRHIIVGTDKYLRQRTDPGKAEYSGYRRFDRIRKIPPEEDSHDPVGRCGGDCQTVLQ